jgi:NAD(P)-dependent dehydrogenase (short-subunit alcohol dehydrogenase family)
VSDIAGKSVLITGAATGIGRALAEGFRADGALVAGCDLAARVEEAREVCDLAEPCDVRDADQVRALVDATVAKFGRLDVVVANAGTGRFAAVLDADWADLHDVVDVNLFGVLHTLRAALPRMRAQGSGRAIVVVSRNAEFCPPELAGYSMSKAAAVVLTRTLARELQGEDVLVNNLIPGPTLTELNPRGTQPPEAVYPTARMLATLPAGGPSGRTFWNGEEYPFWSKFSGQA